MSSQIIRAEVRIEIETDSGYESVQYFISEADAPIEALFNALDELARLLAISGRQDAAQAVFEQARDRTLANLKNA